MLDFSEEKKALSRAVEPNAPGFSVPSPPGLQYRPFQLAAIQYALTPPYRTLIADDMGLGKTIEAIGYINFMSQFEVYTGHRFLIVCPAYLKINWREELKKWLVQPFPTGIAYSGKPFPTEKIVVINYDILHLFKEELDGELWEVMILDESHRLQDKNSRRTVMVYGGSLKVKESKKGRNGRTDFSVYRDVPVSTGDNRAHSVSNSENVDSRSPGNLEKIKEEKDGIDEPGRNSGVDNNSIDVFVGRSGGVAGDKELTAGCSRTPLVPPRQKVKKYKPIHALSTLNLTGTPVYNRPINLWSQLKALRPDIFHNFYSFAKRYCAAKKTPFGWDFKGASNQKELGERLRGTCMVRRLKKDVAKDLPQKIIKRMPFEIGGSTDLDNTFNKLTEVKDALRSGKRFEQLATYRLETGKKKVPFVRDLIKEILKNTSQLAVFAYHREVVNQLCEAFKVQAVSLMGGETAKLKTKKLNQFKDGGVPLLIGTMDAIGEGENLQCCSAAIIAEMDWSSEKMVQAEDRLLRIGQENTVHIFYPHLLNSLDDLMASIAFGKSRNIKTILGD